MIHQVPIVPCIIYVTMKHIKITEKRLEASVYYPMDRQTQDFTARWFEDQDRTIMSMKKVFGPMFEIPYIPDFLLRTYTRIIVPMITKGNLCKRFASG